jgi:Flp pilus assembly protein TadG
MASPSVRFELNSSCRGSSRRQRGQTYVEFALVALPAMIVIYAILQGAAALFAHSAVAYASRCGARYAMVHGSNSNQPASEDSVQSYVRGLVLGLDSSQITVNTTWTPDENPGSTAEVQVSYPFTPFAPFVYSYTVQLSSTTQTIISN